MKRKAKTQKGSVLLAVVVVSMMMVVICAAAISLVGHTQTKTNKEYRQKQAYFLASSCLEGFVTEATTLSDDGTSTAEQAEANIRMLQGIANDNTEVEVTILRSRDGQTLDEYYPRGMGTCTIKVEKVGGSSNNLKAISTAEYLGEKKTVVAYFSVKPLDAKQPMTNALEIIGTDGGGNGSYNNVEVYGNTAASELQSHEVNTWYKFTSNNCAFHGDAEILGTFVVATQARLKGTDYYYEGGDVTKGATLKVSRSLIFSNNQPTLASDYIKTNDPIYDVEPDYNYVYVAEAFVMAGSNAQVGKDGKMVDIYASNLCIGKPSANSASSWLTNAMSASATTSDTPPVSKQSEYQSDALGGLQDGNDTKIWGNIYSYQAGTFNGDIYINSLNNQIHGDIYCSGDLYFNNVGTHVYGTVYMAPGGSVHGSATIDGGIVSNSNWLDWGGRATEPTIATTSDTIKPYVYFPEHMLCTDGVSSIRSTYASFYDGTNPGTLKADSMPILDASNAAGLAQFANTSGITYTNNGVSVTPNYIITKSCILGNFNWSDGARTIMIDVDAAETNADGRNDIVVILKNGCTFGGNDHRILVNNSTTSADGADQRFVYFVSDSGVGTTYDEYGADGVTVSTYEHSTFVENPTYTFSPTSFSYIMDFETYCHSSFSNPSAKINPTEGEIEDTYQTGEGEIIMLLTDGAKLLSGSPNPILYQAAIYAPKAEVGFQNNKALYIMPMSQQTDGSLVTIKCNVLGCCICKNFLTNANNVTIVYQKISENSMLSKAKGSESTYDSGFKLVNYSNV